MENLTELEGLDLSGNISLYLDNKLGAEGMVALAPKLKKMSKLSNLLLNSKESFKSREQFRSCWRKCTVSSYSRFKVFEIP